MARRSIVTRVLVIAVATGFIGATGAVVTSRRLNLATISERIVERTKARYELFESDACRADPTSWEMIVSRNARAYAYSETTLRSLNPNAPPLRADLYARLPKNADGYVAGFGPHFTGVVVLVRRREASPCALIQITAEPEPTRVSRFITAEGIGALVTGLISCVLALALGLPLARRIRRLNASAVHIGTEESYTPCRSRARGDELDELGVALDKAHARIRTDASLLEQRRIALERHLSEIAHDLRTPLTSLQAALERATAKPNATGTPELLTSALFDVVYISALTENLRFASQLRTGWSPNPERVDLCELVEHVGLRAKMLARRRGVTLELATPDAPLLVEVDRVAAEQALTNIVQNAVTYVDTGGNVAIILRAEDGDCAFTVDVRDDGPGVPPLDLPQLGQGTFRSDEARQRDPRGRGIGLAITSEVCRRFRWELSFHALDPRGLGVRVRGAGGR